MQVRYILFVINLIYICNKKIVIIIIKTMYSGPALVLRCQQLHGLFAHAVEQEQDVRPPDARLVLQARGQSDRLPARRLEMPDESYGRQFLQDEGTISTYFCIF